MTEQERDEQEREIRAWVDALPACVLPLVRRFPPCCIVRATRPLVCPPPGSTGHVVSYFEPTPEAPDGLVSVVGETALGVLRAQCEPSWLELVSTEDTHPFVLELLGSPS